MPLSGKPVTDGSVQHVTEEDLRNDVIKKQVETFDNALTQRLNDEKFQLSSTFDGRYGGLDDIDDEHVPSDSAHGDGKTRSSAYGDESTTPSDDEYGTSPSLAEVDDVHGIDQYLNAITIRMEDAEDGKVNLATVVGRNRDPVSGAPLGQAHENPLLDTRKYMVELTDGTTNIFLANQIAENLWAQCDAGGHGCSLHRRPPLRTRRDQEG